MPSTLQNLLDRNRRWAADTATRDPDFFRTLVRQQSPDYLWIGCADSRVPANEIVGLAPGELFVHRNVANLVVHSDLNCLSVLQYAVDVLHVQHVIVCGHYGCGGVRAALQGERHGLVDNWLRHIQDTARAHRHALMALPDDGAREDRLCELNVMTQVTHVCETTVVRDAWARGQKLAVHGLVYHLDDGLLRDLGLSIAGPDELPGSAIAGPSARPIDWPARVADIRSAFGWTPAELGAKLAVDVSSIVDWERGVTKPEKVVRAKLKELAREARARRKRR